MGLLAQEVDHRTGELLGDFPQAFSHVGLTTAGWDVHRACPQVAGEAGATRSWSEG